MSYAKEIVASQSDLTVQQIAPALAGEIAELKQARLTDSERNLQYLKYFSSNEPLHTEQHSRFLEKYGLSHVFDTVYRLTADDPSLVSYQVPGEPGFSVVQERQAHPLELTRHHWDDLYSLVPGAVHSYMYTLRLEEEA
ncbi:MAG: hypothetical protein JWO41_686 [Candidatus Saccharibacteria bacterium]|nr:hypothetical protein [Candidatus Saccharibacteria bacterium]